MTFANCRADSGGRPSRRKTRRRRHIIIIQRGLVLAIFLAAIGVTFPTNVHIWKVLSNENGAEKKEEEELRPPPTSTKTNQNNPITTNTSTSTSTNTIPSRIIITNLTLGRRYPELAFANQHRLDDAPTIATATTAWPNLTTLAYFPGRFYSGYRNQMMGFTMLILRAIDQGHGQVLLPTLQMKDTYGTNRHIPFSQVWNISHFNSYYPRLPRLVEYHPVLHDQYNPEMTHYPFYKMMMMLPVRTTDSSGTTTTNTTTTTNHKKIQVYCNARPYKDFCTNLPVRPHVEGDKRQFLSHYQQYVKGKGRFTVASGGGGTPQRHPAEILMLQSALVPHNDLLNILQDIRIKYLEDSSYMTLHARIEPDMQRHPVCRDQKVLNLTEIIEMMYGEWPSGPPHNITKILLVTNRPLLEQEAAAANKKKNKKKKTSKTGDDRISSELVMIRHNLQVLNRLRDEGMIWKHNGKDKVVQVLEFGSQALLQQGSDTPFAKRSSTVGAMLNFELGIPATVFVGTPVSSYSHDLLATRFFRGYTQANYQYLPHGLVEWTPQPETTSPPGFAC